MSTWKKATKANQHVHRERHQPAERAHLGLLEKKKDYKARADDYHDKQRTLKILRKRALNRNPDEFYFHMINSKVEDGMHHELEKEDEHTPDQIRLMQTQDLKYITTKRVIEKRKIKRLQSQLHLLDAANQVQNKHVFFVDSKKEAKNFDVAERLDTIPDLLDRRINRVRTGDLQTIKLPDLKPEDVQRMSEERKKLYKELAKRIERERQLGVVQRKLEIKRHLVNKKEQQPKRLKPATKDSAPEYEWTFERKR